MDFPTLLGSRLTGFGPQLLGSLPEIWCECGKAFLVAIRDQIARVCGRGIVGLTSIPMREGVLFPPPALSEGSHRSLARALVAVRRRAILVLPEG